jgi:hypothetical protein
MNESHLTGWIASAMQFIVAVYALRLNRRFGTAKVGWSLFGAFSFLALLQLIQSTTSFDAGTDAALKINVVYALISFLLLIGMLHLETMLKERLRLERVEKRLRAELELEVKSKTANLTRAIEELMGEIEETKRMAAIIESAEWTMAGNMADGLATSENSAATTVFDHLDQEAVCKPAPRRFPPGRDDEEEQAMAGILSGEWVAHF